MANSDGGRYPANMKVLNLPHNLTFHPENGEHSLLVSSPEPGDWFLLAYLNKKEKTDYVQEVCKKLAILQSEQEARFRCWPEAKTF